MPKTLTSAEKRFKANYFLVSFVVANIYILACICKLATLGYCSATFVSVRNKTTIKIACHHHQWRCQPHVKRDHIQQKSFSAAASQRR